MPRRLLLCVFLLVALTPSPLSAPAPVAATPQGIFHAWGNNVFLQLGPSADPSKPVDKRAVAEQVPFVDGHCGSMKEVASGSGHNVALTAHGLACAWDNNDGGQLGDGGNVSSQWPARVKGPGSGGYLDELAAVAAGGYHSLALRADGTVWSWGRNNRGQLGDGTKADRTIPVQVPGLNDVIAIDGGQSEAKTIASERMAAVAGGGSHTLAVTVRGSVYTWGANDRGQLGDTSLTGQLAPVPVRDGAGRGFLGRVKAVAGGGEHSLALLAAGTLVAWGRGTEGQLGDGLSLDRPVAGAVLLPTGANGPRAKAIAAGTRHSVALLSDGTVLAWGANDSGQLGDDSLAGKPAPVKMLPEPGDFPARATDVAGGGRHSLVMER